MVVNCSALQLFLAYNLRKPLNLHLIISCNISLYRDTQVAIYRYVQIVYRCISNTHTHKHTYPHESDFKKPAACQSVAGVCMLVQTVVKIKCGSSLRFIILS